MERTKLAVLIICCVLLPVIFGFVPMSIAVVVGAALMVLTGCLTMQEAYRFIEWKAVFLIAGMLPLGIALDKTGAAKFLAEGVVSITDMGMSPYILMMAIAMAASASFMTPISHPANILVMGPGGYRFIDYIKIGLPLTLVVFAVIMFVLPVFWPLK